MKRLIKYIASLVLVMVIASCEKPAPTELLVEEETNLEIDVIPKEPDNYDYDTGYDSTGITAPTLTNSSVITVGSIKTSYNNLTARSILAKAIFLDKTHPIQTPNGRTFGYGTRKLGNVLFENRLAREADLSIRMMDRGAVKDSVVGKYHLLHRRDSFGDQFEFRFNSTIDFKLKHMGNLLVHFQIPTPNEITGTVEISGKSINKNLRFILNWNGYNAGRIDIVVGGVKKGRNKQVVSPYFKLTTPDDGNLNIPAYLLKDFPFEKFDRIVFTFIRQKVFDINQDNTLKDHYIAAYTIHNIQLDIP